MSPSYLILMLLGFAVVSFVQNAAFTWSSRSRNSGDPSYHRKASWASNGIYYLSNALLTIFIIRTQVWWLLVIQGLVYTLSTAEGSVLMMKKLLARETGKRAVGAGQKFAQIPVEEWDKVKRLALTIDLGDGGTFNQDELAVLKQVANEWAEHSAKTDFFIRFQMKVNIENEVEETEKIVKTLQENLKRQIGRQPGPVKVSNATVTVPPSPKPSQGERY